MFVPDSQLRGLYQRERATGNKWVVKAKQRGVNTPVTITLGRVDVIDARLARRLAKEKLAMLAAGINPNLEARKNREADQQLGITLQEALEEYLELRALKPSTIKSYRQVIIRSFGDWADKPIRSISRQGIVKRYQAIQQGISKRALQPEKANPRGLSDAQKSMRYLSAILNSYANDTYQGQPLLPDGNPVLVLKDKKARKKLKERKRFLESAERRALFAELSRVRHPGYAGKLKPAQADFILLLMVTGLRLDEARLLKWENITGSTYTITNTKNGEDHTLPITSTVQSLFDRNQNGSPYVFPGKVVEVASMSSVIKNAADALAIEFTAHDLRRTAATVAAQHGFSTDQIGRLLNHSNKNVTEGYVQRTAEALRPIIQTIEDEILATYDVDKTESTDVDLRGVNLDEAL
ncbi:MAG: tyrosine-type recombinase/integrase [Proteobacteria bacterium]|nr:tyrosine-type recombinase/integrase [Pseudomonadota bacterium]